MRFLESCSRLFLFAKRRKKMRYYRFENYDNELGKVVGGYISLICAMLLMNLDLPADASDDDYEKALAEVKDKKSQLVADDMFMKYICDIKAPGIYITATERYVCLYKEEEYERVRKFVGYFSKRIKEFFEGRYKFICRVMEIPDEEKVYEDKYQIVIRMQRYKKMKCVNTFELTEPEYGSLSFDDVYRFMEHEYVYF